MVEETGSASKTVSPILAEQTRTHGTVRIKSETVLSCSSSVSCGW